MLRLRTITTAAGTALALLAAVVPSPAVAAKTDVVGLYNGDQITGEVKGLTSGTLDYNTDNVGRLPIKWEHVAYIRSIHRFEVELRSGRKLYGQLEQGSEHGFVVVRGPATDTLRIPYVVGITPLDAGILQRTKGYLDLGFTTAKANKATTLNVDGALNYRGPRMGAGVDFDSYEQGQESAPTITRNTASTTVQWFLPKRWAAFGIGSAEQNEELDLLLRLTGGGGMGRVLARSNRMDFTLAGGLVATHERFDVGGDSTSAVDERQNLEGLVIAKWDAFRLDSPKLDFSTSLELYPSLSESGRVRGKLLFRVKYELFPSFHVGIKFNDSFDNKPPADQNIETNDYVTTFTIGWSYRR